MKRIFWLCAFFFGVAGSAETFDRQAWLADFEQLKVAMTRGYPNLEWAAQRGMDLPALERRTREQLGAAADAEAARAALTRFIASFGDGHMRLSFAPATPAAAADSRPLCERLGFSTWTDTTAIARELAGYRALEARRPPISAGVVERGDRRIGVLRIQIFIPDRSMCESALSELAPAGEKSCDTSCEASVGLRAERMLVAEIAAAIRTIVEARPDVLLVDVAGNGGGNDSAIAAARMLTTAPLPTPRLQLLRSPEHAADLAADAGELRKALRRARGAEKTFLADLVARIDTAAREATQACDLSPLWRGQPAGCTNLVGGSIYAAGMIDDELSAGLRSRPWAFAVSATARYDFTPAMWTGPLVVLVDSGSGSATELLTASLKDASRALVVGAPTAGSGCGWILPQLTTVLFHSSGRLTMPDCVRLRRDGTNELDGIEPDVLIGFRRWDTSVQRARRFEAALPRVISLVR